MIFKAAVRVTTQKGKEANLCDFKCDSQNILSCLLSTTFWYFFNQQSVLALFLCAFRENSWCGWKEKSKKCDPQCFRNQTTHKKT